MASKTEISRQEWEGVAGSEDIKIGCLQRIADAIEVTAQNYDKLLIDKQKYERWYKEYNEKYNKANRRISALQGVITRMKKKK